MLQYYAIKTLCFLLIFAIWKSSKLYGSKISSFISNVIRITQHTCRTVFDFPHLDQMPVPFPSGVLNQLCAAVSQNTHRAVGKFPS